jgi:hypothetical protein
MITNKNSDHENTMNSHKNGLLSQSTVNSNATSLEPVPSVPEERVNSSSETS